MFWNKSVSLNPDTFYLIEVNSDKISKLAQQALDAQLTAARIKHYIFPVDEFGQFRITSLALPAPAAKP